MENNIAEELLKKHDDFAGFKRLVEVPGLSSHRVCNFLNRLVAQMEPDEKYLEIGTWKGLTLLSAAHRNFGRICVGCDKFRWRGKFTGFGPWAKFSFALNLRRHRKESGEIQFHSMPYQTLFRKKLVPTPVGVYFYDGNHSYEETRDGIRGVIPFLNRRAVILVDDWNSPVVQAGAKAGLEEGPLTILWQRFMEGDGTEAGWWNGLAAFYVENR